MDETAAATKSKRNKETPETAKEKKSLEDKPGEDEAAKNDGSGKADKTKSKRTDKSNEEEGKKSSGGRVSP